MLVMTETISYSWVPFHESITAKLSQSIKHNAIEKLVVTFIHLFFTMKKSDIIWKLEYFCLTVPRKKKTTNLIHCHLSVCFLCIAFYSVLFNGRALYHNSMAIWTIIQRQSHSTVNAIPYLCSISTVRGIKLYIVLHNTSNHCYTLINLHYKVWEGFRKN